MKYFPLIFLAFLAQMLEGCATEAVMRVGSATNEGIIKDKGYKAAYADDNTLVVHYQTQDQSYREITHERWGSISLGSFEHAPMASLNQDVIDIAASHPDIHIECPASRTKIPKSLPPQIPLYQHHRLSDMKNDRASISAYAGNYSLIILRHNSTHPEEVELKTIGVTECKNHKPWAPFVRAALLPFAVAIDIVTSPIVAIIFFSIGDEPWG
jgi:hypothetical protein